MPLTDAFDGILAAGASLQVVTPGGSPVTVPIQGILDYTPPGRMFKKASYIPQSGTYSGKERVLLGSESAATIEATLVYEQAHQSAMDAITGINACTITLTLPDGAVIAGTGGIEKTAIDSASDTKEITSKVSIALNAGWTYTPGASAATTVTLSSGTGSIDLTASPFTGTGKSLRALTLQCPTTNANPITVAKGVTNGYTGLGATFSVTLAAGEQVTILPATLVAVSASVKLFDVTGTGAQTINVAAVLN